MRKHLALQCHTLSHKLGLQHINTNTIYKNTIMTTSITSEAQTNHGTNRQSELKCRCSVSITKKNSVYIFWGMADKQTDKKIYRLVVQLSIFNSSQDNHISTIVLLT